MDAAEILSHITQAFLLENPKSTPKYPKFKAAPWPKFIPEYDGTHQHTSGHSRFYNDPDGERYYETLAGYGGYVRRFG